MITRCTNPKTVKFSRYGGRGIKVCERWRSFELFLADMGERPEGKTLDRFPNRDGDYEPSNCRWATPKEQVENVSRHETKIVVGPRVLTVKQLAGELGITPSAIAWRIRQKWSAAAIAGRAPWQGRGEARG